MKTILLFVCLALCGCGHPSPSHVGIVTTADRLNGPNGTTEVFFYIVERDGHRFAIVAGANGSGICEITSASLIKTNAEVAK